jgi:hypothetical protein
MRARPGESFGVAGAVRIVPGECSRCGKPLAADADCLVLLWRAVDPRNSRIVAYCEECDAARRSRTQG